MSLTPTWPQYLTFFGTPHGGSAALSLPAATAALPVGGGPALYLRPLLIKRVADVVVRTRRIVVPLLASWPHLG